MTKFRYEIYDESTSMPKRVRVLPEGSGNILYRDLKSRGFMPERILWALDLSRKNPGQWYEMMLPVGGIKFLTARVIFIDSTVQSEAYLEGGF